MSGTTSTTSSSSSFTAGTDPGERSAAQIEREVEQTRANLSQTLEALRDRMSPGQVMDQVYSFARENGGTEFARNLSTQVRDNPIPVALIAAGIGWLLMSGNKSSSSTAESYAGPMRALPPPDRMAHGIGDVAHTSDVFETRSSPRRARVYGGDGDGGGPGLAERAGEAASNLAGSVADAASDVADSLRGAASSVGEAISGAASSVADAASRATGAASSVASRAGDALSDATRRAGGAASDLYDGAGRRVSRLTGDASDAAEGGWDFLTREQPLLLGALGLVMGAALGAMLPRTRAEDRLMGEASDSATRQVGQLVNEGTQRASEAAGSTIQGLVGEAKDRLDASGAPSPDATRQAVAGAAASAADSARDAIRDLAEGAKRIIAEAEVPGVPSARQQAEQAQQ